MWLARSICALPVPLLLLVDAAVAAAAEQQQDSQPLPTAIRKMAPDQGEKFFPHYVAFPYLPSEDNAQRPFVAADGAPPNLVGRARPALLGRDAGEAADGPTDKNRAAAAAAAAAAQSPAEPRFRPAFAAHLDYRARLSGGQGGEGETEAERLFRRAARALARLERRQWGCPAGTKSCTTINQPNACCRDGETCYTITDTGLGSVGCCANGSTCGGTLNNCAPGDTACPSDLGGGCCIAGFSCQGIGCVRLSTTSRTQPPTTTPTPSSTAPPPPPPPTTSSATSSAASSSSTTPQPTATPSTTARTTGTDSGNLPVRPTATESDGFPPGYCPTGFYPCVARAGGGCCQTGRDCATASCPPPPSSTTVVDAAGATVVVPLPVPAGAGAGRGVPTCAGGWFLCPDSAGPQAGCCPSSYACGPASCTLTADGAAATVQKERPNGAAARLVGCAGAVVVGVLVSLAHLL
ncbi:hypothetical protein RB600_008091 [Gaeumannomyces tritici]